MLPWLISAAAVASTLVINHLEEKEEERIFTRNIHIKKKKEERALSSGIYEVDNLEGSLKIFYLYILENLVVMLL